MEIPDIEKYTGGKIVHARQEAVQAVMDFMQDQRYPYWNGRLKKYSPVQIHGFIKEASKGKNPQALFNHLIKKNK